MVAIAEGIEGEPLEPGRRKIFETRHTFSGREVDQLAADGMPSVAPSVVPSFVLAGVTGADAAALAAGPVERGTRLTSSGPATATGRL
jgi:hypothetical protein